MKKITFYIPKNWQLKRSRWLIEGSYKYEINRAFNAKNYESVSELKSVYRYEMELQKEEEDEYFTKRLQDKARSLRVPTPPVYVSDDEQSDYWYQGSLTGGWFLTDLGIKKIRQEIREEQKARRLRVVFWVTVISGFIGVLKVMHTLYYGK